MFLLFLACTTTVKVGDGDDTAAPDSGPADTAGDSAADTGDSGGVEQTGTPCASSWSWGDTPTLASACASFLQEAAEDGAGAGLIVPGDVDGDGLPDLLVAAPFASLAGSESGMLYVVTGVRDRRVGQELAARPAWLGIAAHQEVGQAVALGDVDGDGLADFALTPGWSNSAPPGDEYLVRGHTGAWTGRRGVDHADAIAVNSEWDGNSTDLRSLGPLGDWDGDGLADWLLVGQIGNGGEFEVVSGASASGSVTLPDGAVAHVTGGGSSTSGWFEPAGDLDGDGRGDVLGACDDAGGQLLFLAGTGSGVDTALATTTFLGFESGPAPLGDIDGDGRADLYGLADGAEDARAVELVRGRATWPATVSAADVTLSPEGDIRDVGVLGDVNGDGLVDLGVLEAPATGEGTEVYLYFGRGSWPSTPVPPDVHISITTDVGHAAFLPQAGQTGDIDGDGFDELLVRIPEALVGEDHFAGALVVFRGRAEWPPELAEADEDVRFVGSAAMQWLGDEYAVADFDGDGADDLAFASYVAPSTDAAPGAFVVFGQPE